MSKSIFSPSILFLLIFCGNSVCVYVKISHHHKAAERIVGGSEAEPHSAPFVVALLNTSGHHFCGGSLISRNYILTAAHCLVGESEVVVALGVHNWTKEEPTQIRKTVKSANFKIYPEYKSKIQVYCDLAVIKLPEPINLNDNIQLIPLPPSTDAEKTSYDHGRAYGWGWTASYHSEVLRFADVKVSVIGTNLIGKVDHNEGICNADSGGPLVVDHVQIGINDFVNGKNCLEGVNGYVLVNPFLQWINETTDINIR